MLITLTCFLCWDSFQVVENIAICKTQTKESCIKVDNHNTHTASSRLCDEKRLFPRKAVLGVCVNPNTGKLKFIFWCVHISILFCDWRGFGIEANLLDMWCYCWRVRNTPGVLWKMLLKTEKHFYIPTPPHSSSSLVGCNLKQILSDVMNAVAGWRCSEWYKDNMTSHCVDVLFLEVSTITPKTLILSTNRHQTCKHIHMLLIPTLWQFPPALPGKLYPENRNSDSQLTSTTRKPAACIRFIIGQETFARSTMLVSEQRVFFPGLATILKQKIARVKVRIGGYFLCSKPLYRKLPIHKDSNRDGQREKISRAPKL